MSLQPESRAARSLAPVFSPGLLTEVVRAISTQFKATMPELAVDRVIYSWWLAAIMVAGALLRFWGLGSVGLHGDEETMALAVQGILAEGVPIIPSGMFYPRGMSQLYLMALSVSIFGESEWALRLPSALAGIALIGLAYLVGRRFLRPHWNLAFTASVAFLPDIIVYSQTARMYIFLLVCIMGSMACLFAWERTGRKAWLAGAVAALIVGLDMQALAIGVVLLFLLPGLVGGDTRKLVLGCVAICVVAVFFVLIDGAVSAQYPVPPPEFAAQIGADAPVVARAPQEFDLTFDIALWSAGLAIAFFALSVVRTIAVRPAAFASGMLLLGGIVLQLSLQYHLAALAYLAGAVLARRYTSPQSNSAFIRFLLAIALVALIHAALLASASGTVIKLVGAMVGEPSVWPYVRIAQLSVVAGLLVGISLLWGLYKFVRHEKLPDYWLLAVLGVWAPLAALGAFAWNVPPRYTAMSLIPMLLCAFAFAQSAAGWFQSQHPKTWSRWNSEVIAAALVALCVVNPAQALAIVNAGYGFHPDHKGAAEFLATQNLTADDIVLAEDVLQQTYYLGEVDYWLIGPQVARRFIKRVEDGVVDFYTGTPVIATQAMLDELLQEHPGKRIFVIGSGEDQRNNRRFARGDELHAAIESDRFEVIYEGRDGLTRVLRAVHERVPSPSTFTKAESEADAAALAAEAEEAATAAAPSDSSE